MSVPEISCPSCDTSMPYTAAACPNCRRRMVNIGPSFRVPSQRVEVDYGPTPYLECRAGACAFKVTSKDLRCPNCGAAHPHTASQSYFRFIALLLADHPILFIGAFLTAIFLVKSYCLIVVIVLGILGGALIIRERDRETGAGEAQSRPESLSGSERRIRERLQEISRREGRILSVFARAKQSKGEDWQAVRRRLEDALATLRRQQARYQVKLFEIEAVRWQNRLAPFLYGLEELNEAQCENRLREVEAARKVGDELRARLSKQAAALGAPDEAEELGRKVEETLGSAAKIHEALLARQAVLTLRELGPAADALEAPLRDEGALREVEVFNIQVAITDFSASLEELEAEYARAGDADERRPGGAGA